MYLKRLRNSDLVIENMEKRDLKVIKEVVLGSLKRAHRVYLDLGESGTQELDKNQFGNRVLKMDIECEKAVIDYLKEIKFPIRIYSEEHGVVDIVETPRYLAVLDGLDGSYRFRDDWKNARSGTIFGIFDSVEPKYDDYLVSGFYEHVSDRIFFVERGRGSFVKSGAIENKIKVNSHKELNLFTKIYLDKYWDFDKKFYKKIIDVFQVEDPAIAGVYYSDLASGEYDLVLRCSGKQNLEIMALYGLVREAGGVVVDCNGKDIGGYDYLSFGQDDENQVAIIASASKEFGEMVLDYVK